MTEENNKGPDISEPIVLEEVSDKETIGNTIGTCKWFNDKLGFGFITICDGNDKGKDIFVHHSGINPLNSNYRTLKKGEYINFNITNGQNGLQAIDVTGIHGGPLMCDHIIGKKITPVNGEETWPIARTPEQNQNVQRFEKPKILYNPRGNYPVQKTDGTHIGHGGPSSVVGHGGPGGYQGPPGNFKPRYNNGNQWQVVDRKNKEKYNNKPKRFPPGGGTPPPPPPPREASETAA